MANEYKLPFTGQEITEKLNKISQLTEELNALNEEVDEALEQLSNSKAGNVWYGTCETVAATAEKTVTTSSGDFTLAAGNIVYVLFTETACADATLNVDSTGAITVYVNGTTQVVANQWAPNEVVGFVYDGSAFRMIDGMRASTTYYGMTKLSSSTSSTSTSLAATPSAVKKAYDLANEAKNLVSGVIPTFSYGTEDLQAGVSELATGTIYFVYG